VVFCSLSPASYQAPIPNHCIASSFCTFSRSLFNKICYHYSTLKMEQQAPPKRWYLSTTPHGLTSQTTETFIFVHLEASMNSPPVTEPKLTPCSSWGTNELSACYRTRRLTPCLSWGANELSACYRTRRFTPVHSEAPINSPPVTEPEGSHHVHPQPSINFPILLITHFSTIISSPRCRNESLYFRCLDPKRSCFLTNYMRSICRAQIFDGIVFREEFKLRC
jgi:hypothetical protein